MDNIIIDNEIYMVKRVNKVLEMLGFKVGDIVSKNVRDCISDPDLYFMNVRNFPSDSPIKKNDFVRVVKNTDVIKPLHFSEFGKLTSEENRVLSKILSKNNNFSFLKVTGVGPVRGTVYVIPCTRALRPMIENETALYAYVKNIQKCDIYWFINSRGVVCPAVTGDSKDADDWRTLTDNRYDTKDAAESARGIITNDKMREKYGNS